MFQLRRNFIINFEGKKRIIIFTLWLHFLLFVFKFDGDHSIHYGNKREHTTSNTVKYMLRNDSKFLIKYTKTHQTSNKTMFEILDYFQNIKKPSQLISTANQMLLATLRDILGSRTKAVLMDLANIENKGDPAITIGELRLLAKLNITVIYYCWYTCGERQFLEAASAAKEYPIEDVAILSSGGGNFGIYRYNDYKRMQMVSIFTEYKFVLLSQSVWFGGDPPPKDEMIFLHKVRKSYNKHDNFVMILRDLYSFNFCLKYFRKSELYLAPDMVFGNSVEMKKIAPPLFQIIWITRHDMESAIATKKHTYGGYKSTQFPKSISYVKGDWFGDFNSPMGKDLIDWSYMMFQNGMLFLQRGELIITDRLHGFLLSTLINLQAIVIDNKIHKISHFIDTWCAGLEHLIIATPVNVTKAALQELKRLQMNT